MIKTAIINADHRETPALMRILLNHPDVMLSKTIGPEGMEVTAYHPTLLGETDLVMTSDSSLDGIDVAFVMPGKFDVPDESFVGKVIDLSEPRRKGWTYGLSEWTRKEMVRGSKRVTIPGPLSEAVLLALLPAAHKMLLHGDINVSAVVATGGETPLKVDAPNLESRKREIADVLADVQPGFDAQLNYSTFSSDGRHGVLAVIDMPLPMDLDSLTALYTDFYSDHNFTHLCPVAMTPDDVRSTNKCLLHLSVSPDGQRLVIASAIDPRQKGRVGNAVHVFNLLFGLHERTGLR